MSLLMILGSSHAYAIECVPTNVLVPEFVLNVPSATIDNPIPNGTGIGPLGVRDSQAFVFNGCGNGSVFASQWVRGVKNPVGYYWGGIGQNGIYPTGVPGLGYTIDTTSYNVYAPLPVHHGPGDTGHRLFQGNYGGTMGIIFGVGFRSTANIPPGVYNVPRQVVAIQRSRSYEATSIDGAPSGTSNLVINGFTLTVKAPTCDLATGDTNRTITLPTVKQADFSDTSAGKTNFEITANCTNASNVNFRFTGTASSNDAWRFANTGTANGVDLWLYSRIGGTEQTITANGDNNSRSIAVSSNRAVLPLGAAYYRTGSGAINAGTLRSVVTVNITYN